MGSVYGSPLVYTTALPRTASSCMAMNPRPFGVSLISSPSWYSSWNTMYVSSSPSLDAIGHPPLSISILISSSYSKWIAHVVFLGSLTSVL